MSDDVVYNANIRVERIAGPLRKAFLPEEDDPIFFSVHTDIADHYGVDPALVETHATTIDYLVAAAGG